MKTLLINPPTPTTEEPSIPPLGIAYIAAFLRDNNIKIDIIDLDLEREKFQSISDHIISLSPDLVGIGGLTLQMENVYRLAKIIKKISNNIIVVVGGPHPSSLPEQTLKEGAGDVDIVVMGEGEYTLLDIVKNKPWEDIEGIVYTENNTIHRNKKREPISDLDSLPWPARDMLKIERYRGWGPLKKVPSTHLIASRGCPFDCIFCSEKAVFGRNHRRRAPEKIIAEIEYLMNEYGMKEISFYDDLFTIKKDWVISICQETKQRGIKIDWKVLSRVDTVDYEILKYMKEAGCWIIFYGFESGSQKILDDIRKKQTVEQNIKAAELTKKAGIEMYGFFMIGNIGETEETVYQTIKIARKIKPKHYQFTIVRPDPGSDLYNSYVQEINKKGISWSEYYAFPRDISKIPVVGTELSNEELIDFRNLANRSMSLKSLFKYAIKSLLTLNIKQFIRIIKIFL